MFRTGSLAVFIGAALPRVGVSSKTVRVIFQLSWHTLEKGKCNGRRAGQRRQFVLQFGGKREFAVSSEKRKFLTR